MHFFVSAFFYEFFLQNNDLKSSLPLLRFSRYFWGVMPSIFLNMRCRTVRSAKPHCCLQLYGEVDDHQRCAALFKILQDIADEYRR